MRGYFLFCIILFFCHANACKPKKPIISHYKKTYVANAYPEEIQVRVTVNKMHVTYRKVDTAVTLSFGGASSSSSGSVEEHYEYIDVLPGFNKIRSHTSLAFSMTGNDGRVFVSIVSGSRKIADNFPVYNDYSIIVDKYGYVQHAKYGEVWMDTSGNRY